MTTPNATTLVTGATGEIGGSLTTILEAEGHPLRVMCRRQEQIDRFRAKGIDAVHGDFTDPRSVRTALEGCDQLFLLPPFTPQMPEQTRPVIDAARDAGVRHVVKISASDARPGSPMPWAANHALIDDYLRESGLGWTCLRPGAFMSLLVELGPIIRRGLLPGSSGHGATTWIDSADIAAAAARVLTDPIAQGGSGDLGRSYLLTGTQPLSFPQVAATLTEELGHRVRYVHVPGPLIYLGARMRGVAHPEARGMVSQFSVVVRRGLDGVRVHSTELEQLLGRPPVDMTTYVRAHLTELVGGDRGAPSGAAHSG